MGKQNLLEKLIGKYLDIILGDDAIWSKNHYFFIQIQKSYVYLIWNLELGIL